MAEGPRPPGARFTQGLLDEGAILAALEVRAGQTVLDAGCGNGYMALKFAAAVGGAGKVVALDRDASFIEALRPITDGTNMVAIQADICGTTPLPSTSVDLIYLSTVFHIFSPNQRGGFFREARRLLKPGGLLAIVEIEKRETPFGPPLERRWDPEDLKALCPMPPGRTTGVGKHFYMQLFKNG